MSRRRPQGGAPPQGLPEQRTSAGPRYRAQRASRPECQWGGRPIVHATPRSAAYAGALAALLNGAEARGQCQYEVTVIEGVWCGPVYGYAATIPLAINECGDIAGYFSCPGGDDRAFLWISERDDFVIVPTPPGTLASRALDVNDQRVVVGWADMIGDSLAYVAFLYDRGDVVPLGVPAGGNISEAEAVNSSRQVVGYWGNVMTGKPPFSAFLWQDGSMSDLLLPVGPDARAADINDRGHITGWMGTATHLDSRAFVWNDGEVTELPAIPGGFTSAGSALNDLGDVVGIGRVRDPDSKFGEAWRGFAWINGQMIALEPPSDYSESYASDINNARQVVGNLGPYAKRGIIWQHGTMTPLSELVRPAIPILYASAINDAGQIAAYGEVNNDVFAVLLTPTVRPVGDLDGDCHVGLRDLLSLLQSWGPCNEGKACRADFNGDGVIDGHDLAELLRNWT